MRAIIEANKTIFFGRWESNFKPAFSRLSIKNWYFASYGSLAYKQILSISVWSFTSLSNAFVFPDPEPLIINILHGWSGICSQSRLCYFMVSFVTSLKLIIFRKLFTYFLKFFNKIAYLSMIKIFMHALFDPWGYGVILPSSWSHLSF